MRNIHRYIAALAAGTTVAMLGVADNEAQASNFQAPNPRASVMLPPQYHGNTVQLSRSVRAANQRDPGCTG